MYDDLLRRLQDRIRRKPSTDLESAASLEPRPVLTPEAIESAEYDLGFTLPQLVRDLYLRVADGGFGPGWGVESLDGIVEWDHACRAEWEGGTPPAGWPDKLVRFCEWGGNFWSGVDCSSERCAVIRFDPDRDADGLADHLVPECDSLAAWLTAWLDGEDLWNRLGAEH